MRKQTFLNINNLNNAYIDTGIAGNINASNYNFILNNLSFREQPELYSNITNGNNYNYAHSNNQNVVTLNNEPEHSEMNVNDNLKVNEKNLNDNENANFSLKRINNNSNEIREHISLVSNIDLTNGKYNCNC